MGDHGKILLVGDQDSELGQLGQILITNGFSVICAPGETCALWCVMTDNPDLVLISAMDSDGNREGCEITRKLKMDEETRFIPVVVIISAISGDSRIRALDAGADDFMVKPLDGRELLARVNTLLEKKGFRIREYNYIKNLEREKDRSETLLLNVLPTAVVNRLKINPGIFAEDHPDASVLFADIVGFTRFAASIPVLRLINCLNEIFSAFDSLAEKYRLEKI